MMYPGGASLIASATWLRISSISWRICWMYSSREILGVGSMARSSLGKSLTYIDQTAWIAPGKFATHERYGTVRPGGGDGQVPYASAHHPGAVSELIVHTGHYCLEDPRVIEEVARILKEHATP